VPTDALNVLLRMLALNALQRTLMMKMVVILVVRGKKTANSVKLVISRFPMMIVFRVLLLDRMVVQTVRCRSCIRMVTSANYARMTQLIVLNAGLAITRTVACVKSAVKMMKLIVKHVMERDIAPLARVMKPIAWVVTLFATNVMLMVHALHVQFPTVLVLLVTSVRRVIT